MKDFNIWETGGGCKAYGTTYKNGNYTMITDLYGGQLPNRYGSLICTYDSEGNILDESQCRSQRQLELLIRIHKELYGQKAALPSM